jgi:acyl phosphate:glycerol-3-phosphate acyltransferase
MTTSVLLIAAGYLVGSIPFGYWLVRAVRHADIRTLGSGNIGATNVWRTFGWRLGVPVMLLDVAKGFVPAFVALQWAGSLTAVLAGGAAMVGHARPIFLGFAKGGKAVATAAGAFFALAPAVGLLASCLWIVVFVLTRYASVASMLAACSLPVLAWALDEPWPVVAFAGAAAVVVVVLHRANVRRLIAGTESRASLARRRRRARPTARAEPSSGPKP